MKSSIFIVFAFLLAAQSIQAQGRILPYPIAVPKTGQVTLRDIHADYNPSLQLMEAPAPDGNSEKAQVARLKDELAARYAKPGHVQPQKTSGGAPDPWVGTGFRSNVTIDGVPNDNDMAISDSGHVVSVINSNIWVHDEDGSIVASNISLDAWSQSLGLNGSKFDPRALYDPVHGRFIIVALNGFTDSTSYMIVGFSQTMDPAGAWNLYALPGDPRGDSLWTDYPIMALTQHELFLTANLLYNNQPWQTGFQRSVCWQIDLESAYAGATLQTNLWDSVYFGNRPVRNLCPVQGGSMPAGPNIYLLSNRNLSTGNDTVWIMEITDTIGAPGLQMTVDFEILPQSYALPPNGMQVFNQQVATNDARWLDAMIENDMIQFVGNTLDTSTGRSAVYHGIIRDVSTVPTTEGHILAYPGGAYGYPGIAWLGMAPGSDEALIGLNYLGATNQEYPGCGAIYFDGTGNYSEIVKAKTGLGYIGVLSGLDRWGDYMGVQTRYNQPGVAWIAGTWGQSSHYPATWVAEFHNPAIVATEAPAPIAELTAFPSPMEERLSVTFNLPEDEFMEITLIDMQGRVVRTFLRDRVRAGENRFSFSAGPLATGTYILRLDGQSGTHMVRQVVKTK